MGWINSKIFLFLLGLIAVFPAYSQQNNTKGKGYFGVHKVTPISALPESEQGEIKNVVLMIGDGMGSAHVTAALIANKGSLYMDNMPVGGAIKVYSFSDLITDSGASGTAMATGKKTINGMVGVDIYEKSQKTILEIAESKDLSTGIVVTSTVTHATPAAFMSHVLSRNYYEEIAEQYLKADIDVFIGGGGKNFQKRIDKQDLLVELMKKNYQVIMNPGELNNIHSDKVAGLLYDNHPPAIIQNRGDMLVNSTKKALEILNKNEKGFFLLVEGSQIDWGGHANDLNYIIEETLDFDKAVGTVLEFAQANRETLVIVTADHETGGLVITGGDLKKGTVEGVFGTKNHSGTMVPVFAYGPGSEDFGGIYDNTEIFHKINKLLFKK